MVATNLESYRGLSRGECSISPLFLCRPLQVCGRTVPGRRRSGAHERYTDASPPLSRIF
jgi:hypothetical protein